MEIVSGAAGLSFLLSALLHMLLFGLWGIDFTTVATVEDILLGGIKILAVFVGITIPMAAMLMSVFRPGRPKKTPSSGERASTWLETRNPREALSMLGTLWAGTIVAAFATRIFPEKFPEESYYAITYGILMFVAASLLAYQIRTSRYTWVGAFRQIPLWAFLILANITITGAIAVIITLKEGYPSITFDDSSFLPSECRSRHHILWLGDKSVVIRCSTAVYVLSRREEMTFRVHVRPPKNPMRGGFGVDFQ